MDAVIRRFEIIGESTKRLSLVFCQQHPDIPWQDMAGMRDRVIHGYDSVDWSIVWKTARERLPDLTTSLESILAGMEPPPESNE